MSAWSNGVYTTKGLKLLAKLTEGSPLKITRAVTGTGYVNPDNLAQQTAVTGEKQELAFHPATYPEVGQCKLPMYLSNEGVTTAYTAHQIGLYAYDPDMGEILYFISQSEDGTDIPTETLMPGYSATWTFYFKYGQADNVEVTVDPSNEVTLEMLEEVVKIAEAGVSEAQNGSAIVAENAAALPFAGLIIYGKSEQDGTPTPDAPVDITSVAESGSIEVDVYGKNLLRTLVTSEFDGITLTVSDDGSAVANGTATAQFNYSITNRIENKYGGYILSGAPSGYGSNCCLMVGYYNEDGWMAEAYDTGSGLTIKGADYAPYISIALLIRNGVTVTNASFKPMLSRDGGTYEPYTVQKATIATPNGLMGVPVATGGNYTDTNGQHWICDELDLMRGVYIQRVTKKVFDGTEDSWRQYGEKTVFMVDWDEDVDGGWVDSQTISTHFVCNATNAYVGTAGYFAIDHKALCYFANGSTTLDDFLAWITENPVTVYCALAEPVETALSASEIAACKALIANNPLTTVLNDASAEMLVDCINAQHEAGFRHLTDTNNPHSVTPEQIGAVANVGAYYGHNATETLDDILDTSFTVGFGDTTRYAELNANLGAWATGIQIFFGSQTSTMLRMQLLVGLNGKIASRFYYSATASWSAWKYEATTDYAVNKAGDTMTGRLRLNAVSYLQGVDADGSLYIGAHNTDDFSNRRMLRISNAEVFPDKNKALSFFDVADETVNYYDILHTGNKPSGGYTGNGDATSRTIDTGGTGNVCLVTGYGRTVIVTRYGAFGIDQYGELFLAPYGEASFRAGVLTLATAGALNMNGYSYEYQVL